MSLLDIYVLGAPVLREETKPVEEVTDELRALIDDMFETMYAARGIGLAAPGLPVMLIRVCSPIVFTLVLGATTVAV